MKEEAATAITGAEEVQPPLSEVLVRLMVRTWPQTSRATRRQAAGALVLMALSAAMGFVTSSAFKEAVDVMAAGSLQERAIVIALVASYAGGGFA